MEKSLKEIKVISQDIYKSLEEIKNYKKADISISRDILSEIKYLITLIKSQEVKDGE
jgi:hypothetical protein